MMTITEIAIAIFTLVLSVAVGFVITILKERVGTEKMVAATSIYNKFLNEMHVKNSLASIAVKYVQQLLPANKADEKFSEAALFLSKQLSAKGFKVTDTEIKALVESAVKEAKKEFGDQWKKSII